MIAAGGIRGDAFGEGWSVSKFQKSISEGAGLSRRFETFEE